MSNIQSALTYRDSGIVQANLVRPDATVFVARSDVVEGEQLVRVRFPVEFTDQPFFAHGSSVRSGSVVRATMWPLVSACVRQWNTVNRGVVPHFVGADVMVIVEAPRGTRIEVDMHFTGIALAGARGR